MQKQTYHTTVTLWSIFQKMFLLNLLGGFRNSVHALGTPVSEDIKAYTLPILMLPF